MTARQHAAVRVPLRALVVEDSENDALLLLRELKRAGYEVSHERVYTPEAMEEALDRGPWDVVVSDYYMPSFRAPDALKLLRERGYDAPFVIVSGKVGEELAVEAMKAGAYDYIMKDNMTRLGATIERGLGEAELRREREKAQEALVESEERFRSLVRNASDMIVILDADGTILYESPAVEPVLGFEPEERIGTNAFDYVHPDDVELFRSKFDELLEDPECRMTAEYRVQDKGGSWRHLEAIGTNLFDNPTIRGIVVNIRDVTERRQAEEKYRSIFENSAEGIYQTALDGRFLTANPAMARILGYSSPEELMMAVSDVASQLYEDPDDRAEFVRLVRQQDSVSGFETRLRRADGGVIWTSTNARALRDEAGRITAYEGMLEDITERKEAEEGLRQSLERLVTLHAAGQILSSTLEPEEIGTRLLEVMRRIAGLTTAVISLSKNGRLDVWRSIGMENLSPRKRYTPEVREALRTALEKESSQVFAPDLSGAAGPAVGVCLPLRVREHPVGLLEVYGPEALAEKENVAMLESLANQAASALENARLYGELQEREKRLQELVGKILVAQEEERRRIAYEVHDGLAQVAAAAHQHLQAFAQYHPPASPEGQEDLVRVAELVRQSVGEARRIIADLRPTALDEFGLKSAVRLHIDTLRAEGWRIGYEASLGDERLPAAMETAIFRVVQEALNNVGKHAGTKKADVSLERRRNEALAPSERGCIRLTVRDYGRGFTPESSDDGSGGPGERVGLMGMRERITLLGGEFRVASRPNEGTLVVAEIPLP